MSKVDLVVRVAGEGGEGVISCGTITAEAFARVGLNIYTFTTFPAEIKGGPAMKQIRASSDPVLSQGDQVDVLVAFNEEAWQLHHQSLRPGAALIYDPDECEPQSNGDYHAYPIPFHQIARQEVGAMMSMNVVILGILSSFMNLPEEFVGELVRQKYLRRANEIVQQKNALALELGYKHGREHIPAENRQNIDVKKTEDVIIMSGNEGIAVGAILAGLKVYCGYPITPATDIMEFLVEELPAYGGLVVQTEDEIAAVTMCIGASFGGAKAMTASAGPGIALMTEGIGLASMIEQPLVIVDAQRGGPSTGMPTRVEQSDLDLAVYGRHGDAPRIVLAPTDVRDCIDQTITAFNLAEKYQTPVLLLTDQNLAIRTQVVEMPDLDSIETIYRKGPPPEQSNGAYERYEMTPDNISPIAVPGKHEQVWVATGLEHDEHAHINYSEVTHKRMMEKRANKIAGAAKEPGLVEIYGDEEAKVGLLTWGSSAGVCREAINRAGEGGIAVKGCFPRMLHPIPDGVHEFLNSVETIIIAELNHSGQYANMIQADTLRPVIRVNKYTGYPFTVKEILDAIEGAVQGG